MKDSNFKLKGCLPGVVMREIHPNKHLALFLAAQQAYASQSPHELLCLSTWDKFSLNKLNKQAVQKKTHQDRTLDDASWTVVTGVAPKGN